MARKEKKFHFIYKTTNIISNKFYIGMHSTDDPEDGYLGSGKRLRYSINKYGKENHKLEILEFLSDRIELKEKEKELVNEDILKDPMCMNLMTGGEGGFNEEGSKFAINQWKDPHFRKKKNEITSKNNIRLHREGILCAPDWTGKKHSKKTINKMRESQKGNHKGKDNSQFGTCWITNNKDNRKINKEELSQWIQMGWIKGRISNI